VFNQFTIEFYKHLIKQEIIRILNSKVKTIQKWSQSRNMQKIRQFYNLINYYRWFIWYFNIIAIFYQVYSNLKIMTSENDDQLFEKLIINWHFNDWNKSSQLHQFLYNQIQTSFIQLKQIHQILTIKWRYIKKKMMKNYI